jgi:hypothetical protein
MKHRLTRFGMLVLLIGLIALAAGRASGQSGHHGEIIVESSSWGISSGQTARISVVHLPGLGDGSVRTNDPAIVRIQLLDTEGQMVAQSDDIRIEPGKTRFWDAPYEQIAGAREPTGRLQLRARLVLERRSSDRHHPPVVTLDIFDSSTGATSQSTFYNPFVTVDYIETVPPRNRLDHQP